MMSPGGLRPGLLTMTDARIDSGRIPGPRSAPVQFILIEGGRPFAMADEFRARAGQAPCPCCEGRELPRRAYCLMCDRTGLDGKVLFPGLAVDEAPDPLWKSRQEGKRERERLRFDARKQAKRAAKLARRMTG